MVTDHQYSTVYENGKLIRKPLLRFKNGIPQDEYTRKWAMANRLSQKYVCT